MRPGRARRRLLHWFYAEGFVPGAGRDGEGQPAAGQLKVSLGADRAIGERAAAGLYVEGRLGAGPSPLDIDCNRCQASPGPQMLELAAANTAASAVARAAGALLVDYARAPAATDEQAGGEDEAAATGATGS